MSFNTISRTKVMPNFRLIKRPTIVYSSLNLKIPLNQIKNSYVHFSTDSNNKNNQNRFLSPISKFSKEIYRIIKEELLYIKSYKKADKTYAKIDEKTKKKIKEKKDVQMNTTVTSVQEVKREKTFWEKLFSTKGGEKVYNKYKGYSQKFVRYSKTNPHFKKFENLKYTISDKVEDFKEAYETSQNPLLWKVKDVGDRLFAENDTSYALRKVIEVEPDFSAYEFLNELKMHILPVIVEAILKCDLDFIKETCIENGYKEVYAYIKAREQYEDNIDCQLIDILDANFEKAMLNNKVPVLYFSCIGQHLETVTPKKVKKGQVLKPTYFMKNIYYLMAMTPDKECPIFGWKFVGVQMQQVYALKS